RDFGLHEQAEAGFAKNSVKLKTSRGTGELLLYEGPKKRLHHIALAAPGDEFEAVRAALKRAAVPEIDPPNGSPEGGIWFQDPDGNLINLRPEAKPAIPSEPLAAYNGPGNPARPPATRNVPDYDRALPRRL